MKITYSAMCPDCKLAGKETRLYRDLTEPEKVACAEGHSFQGPEIEDWLTSQEDAAPAKKEEPKVVKMPSVPKETTEELESDFGRAADRADEIPPGLLQMAPPPNVTEALVEAARTSPEPAKATAVMDEPVSAVRKAPAALRPSMKELPGGALELTVVIPDPHASYLTGEAQFRGKTVLEHFQEMVEYGLDARWFY